MPRKFTRPRCPVCGLHDERCLCATLPVRDLATRFVVVQHNRERTKPTSTGRVAAAVLRAPIIHYGAQGEEMDTGALEDTALDYFVLFPSPGAPELGEATTRPADGKQRCIVLLDGTWHQCSRMARRAAKVCELPHRTLPPGPPSRWGVRTPPHPGALCTFEAAARVVELLHGPEAAAPMTAFFAELSARMLAMRGRLPNSDVDSDDE